MLLLLALTALGGCGSRVGDSPTQATIAEDTITVHVPFEGAWGAVGQTFFDRTISIRT